MNTELIQEVDLLSNQAEEIVREVVSKYFDTLDDVMQEITDIIDDEKRLSNEDIEYYLAYLPPLMYRASDCQENIGVKADIANALRKERFNVAYSESGEKTVQAKTSEAQLKVLKEETIQDIYKRCYKKIEQKVERCEQVIASLKRILQWRITDLELNGNYQSNGTNFREKR